MELPSHLEIKTVTLAWEAFIAGELPDSAPVRPIIRASWQRSLDLGIDPYLDKLPRSLPEVEFETLQDNDDLVHVAKPYLETLPMAWPDNQFLVGVTNRQGKLLLVESHPVLQESAEVMNAKPGAGMAEEHIGTAVTSIILAQNRPDWVLWSEHYCQAFHRWAVIGAPIHHPSSKEIIGILSAAQEELTHPHALNVISNIAQRLEQLLHREELGRRVQLVDEYQRFLFSHPQDIVLALDVRGYIRGVSPAAYNLFHTGPRS